MQCTSIFLAPPITPPTSCERPLFCGFRGGLSKEGLLYDPVDKGGRRPGHVTPGMDDIMHFMYVYIYAVHNFWGGESLECNVVRSCSAV